MYIVDNFINGAANTVSDDSSLIIDPSYGKDIGKVLYATTDSADLAIESAKQAFENWSLTGLSYRACLLYTSPSPRDRTRSRMPSSA